MNSLLNQTIIFIMILSYGLHTTKSTIIFDENNQFKKFGLNKGETIFPFWVIITIGGFFFYYICLLNKGNYI